jgi:hypothetical protein
MTARRSFRFAFLTFIAAAALASGACASAKTVNDILADPSRYRNRTVKLSGEVVESYSAANRGAYRIDDGTGEIWIVSEKGVPRRTARVTVKGKVREGFNFDSLGAALKLPPALATGIVLIESSHKAKR